MRDERISKKESRWLRGPLAGLAAVLVLAGMPATSGWAQTWNGSVSDLWGTAGNWTPNTVPNSSTATAIINSATNNPVLVNGSFTVGDLTLSNSTNSVDINAGQTLSINAGGTISNAGAILLNGNGGGTYLYAGNGNSTTTLTGGGTVTLANSDHNAATIIYGDGNVILDNVNNTIQGEGQIGLGHGFSLENGGTVDANVTSQTLTLNGTGGSNSNTGTLEATGGGTLQIENSVNNAGGLISTDTGNGSVVLLTNSATIQGGTLNGNIQVSNGTLNGVTNLATVTVNPGTQTNILGTINNQGTILLNGNGGGTYLYAGNGSFTTTLTGGGTVTLSNSDHNGATLIYGDGGVTLENVNNTIQGEGSIGDNHGMAFQNDTHGIVDANVAAQTLVLNGSGGVTNAGTLEATLGGTLQINNTVNNSGGLIATDSGNGSQVLLNGATIQGGTLNETINTEGGTLLDGRSTSEGPVTISSTGTVTVLAGNQLNILGTITNNGSIVLNGNGGGTYLYAGNGSFTTTLTGGGTVTLVNSDHNGATGIYGDGGVTLENVNNTIQGEGNIGFGHGFAFQNDAAGVVNANVGGQTLTLQASNGGATNTGLLEATSGGTLQILNTTVTNNGGLITTDSGNGSQVLLNGATIQGGTLNGTINTEGGSLLDGSTSQGHVTISSTGTVTVLAGNQLNILGTITNNGSIVLNGNGGGTYLYAGNGSFTTTLTGGGTVTLVNSDHNGATGIYGDGGVTLENVNNTIQGEGNIGFGHGFAVLNDAAGIVNANVGGQTLTLQATSGVTNTGLLEATSGGTLQILNTTVNNSGGLITTDSGNSSQVLLNGATIQGGTLNGTVNSENSLLDGRSTSEGTLTIAGTGTVTVLAGQQLNILGTINNTGSIVLAGNGAGTDLYVGNGSNVTTTLTGNGTITLANSDHNGVTGIYGDGSATLVNEGNTIQGEGFIGANHGMSFLNDGGGTVLANVTGQTLNVNPSEGSTNNGTFKATNGGTLLVSTGLTNWNGTNTLTGGTYIVNGTAGNTSTLQINSLGTTGGEITTIGANTTVTLDGINANVRFVDQNGNNAISNLNTNNGTLNLLGGYTFDAPDTNFTDSGDVLVGTGSTFQMDQNTQYIQTAGITQVDGELASPMVNINGGMLGGDGTVSGAVTIAGGAAIQAGDTQGVPTDPPGTLNIVGPLDLNNSSTVNEAISGSALADISLLNVTGNVDLGSSVGVDVMLLNGFDPTTASQFVFLNYTGTLNAQNFFVTDANVDPFGTFGIGYGAGDAYLTFTPNGPPPTATPEPAAFLPLVGLLASVAYGIRRRKQGRQTA